MATKKRVKLSDVKAAEKDYANAVGIWGEHNLETQRRMATWYELKAAWEAQKGEKTNPIKKSSIPSVNEYREFYARFYGMSPEEQRKYVSHLKFLKAKALVDIEEKKYFGKVTKKNPKPKVPKRTTARGKARVKIVQSTGYLARPSNITGKKPSRRLRSRRAANTDQGYFPNPVIGWKWVIFQHRDALGIAQAVARARNEHDAKAIAHFLNMYARKGVRFDIEHVTR